MTYRNRIDYDRSFFVCRGRIEINTDIDIRYPTLRVQSAITGDHS